MLEGELSDPRIFPSVVTEVVLAPGGKAARVFVAVTGGEEEEASTLDALTAARGFIRAQIRDRMGVRHVPELSFAIDRSARMTGRMEELLGRAAKRARKKTTPEQKTAAPQKTASDQAAPDAALLEEPTR